MSSTLYSLASSLVMGLYVALLGVLMIYGLHRFWIVYLYCRYHKGRKGAPPHPKSFNALTAPVVTIQLPLYNEMYVAERLIDSICALDYPKEKLEIQVLDDSTDRTVQIVERKVAEKRAMGFDIHQLRRGTRTDFKAGALAWGLKIAKGEFIGIFDADFMPPSQFLKATLPYFSDSNVGMVQTRWGHVNQDYSLLTRLQALFLDGHFLLEHTARYKSGAFFNFNGTAGIWRKAAIETSGGWSARALTEDLDLSYRAQLQGWKFVYMPEFVCPAELPVDINAFRTQQRRWTKGAIQVARILLKDLWRAPLPLHTKVEATAHLTANVGYLLVFVAVLLLLPSLILRGHVFGGGIAIIEISVFFVSVFSMAFFYVFSQRELYPDWRWRIKDIPVLLSFGIGMSVSNAMAVWEGLTGQPSDFVRTPKYGIQRAGENWLKKDYARRKNPVALMPLFLTIYSGFTLYVALIRDNWAALPFIAMFIFGFSYLAGLSILQRIK
ncbi:MAG: glycosyltransferase family 2 protein [Elusimicrobia bacterium]|nr:glycosyltransferase family 2 protein [Candidatus Obscuribacterium magneticum]